VLLLTADFVEHSYGTPATDGDHVDGFSLRLVDSLATAMGRAREDRG
jgi:hypothetical protein